jgi:putative chitinase
MDDSKPNLTFQQFKVIAPNCSEQKRAMFFEPLNTAMRRNLINTPARVAAFMAQIMHESGEMRWLEEIWGPTPAQKRYEGRADLGNFEQGDGYKFRGRGLIQLTGRNNYRVCGQSLGLNLEANPHQASTPEVASQIAAWFWSTRKPFIVRYMRRVSLNELADKGHFEAITRAINGGLNGLEARVRYWERAKQVLGLK